VALATEKQQSRAMESEMLNEQATLESKLESFRVRAEEASSADQGHLQAKLLRQIETLQTQHSTASQNWQGIESTLMGRITSLEQERDEVVSREADLRKKLRDSTLRAKKIESELDDLRNKFADVDKSVADAEAETQRLTRRVAELEEELAKARKDLEEQKSSAERDVQRKIEEEKSKWTASLHIQRVESPGNSIRKGSGMGFDMNHLMSPTQYERPHSRRSSIMASFDSYTPPRQQSTTSFRALANSSIPETPSVVNSNDADEYFANVPPTPISANHHSHRGLNDLVSTSTIGAGPSVQLVERMSANVRRLESEKSASKDELGRITGQRDEARQQVVDLMREVEEKRKTEQRLNALEKEHQALSQRHQTTLEILGEKSEQVEELKADIMDVKQMYRQLADTMK
jgi:chromosome segregation ATPase